MPSQTTIRVCDASGNFLFETAQFLEAGSAPGLHYVLSVGNIGAMTVTLPPDYNDLLPKDGRIFIMRSVNGNTAIREGGSCYLIRKWEYADDYTTITAVHANDLMRRRFLLYDPAFSGSGTDITAMAADDAMKGVWRHNAGNTIDVGLRSFSSVTATNDHIQEDWSASISVQANATLGAVITINKLAFMNMLDVFHVLADASYANGIWLTAEIVTPTESTLELQTFISQRGTDRRFSTASGLIFDANRGNLANVILTIDAIEEKTMAQSLGASPQGARFVGTYHDSNRIYDSPFARIETIFDMNDAPNDSGLTHGAKSAVQAGWPRVYTSAELTETDQCIRGVHFDLGDYVTIEIRGVQYDMRLNQLDVSVTAQSEVAKVGFYQELQTVSF